MSDEDDYKGAEIGNYFHKTIIKPLKEGKMPDIGKIVYPPDADVESLDRCTELMESIDPNAPNSPYDFTGVLHELHTLFALNKDIINIFIQQGFDFVNFFAQLLLMNDHKSDKLIINILDLTLKLHPEHIKSLINHTVTLIQLLHEEQFFYIVISKLTKLKKL